MVYRLIIAGSRTFNDYDWLKRECGAFLAPILAQGSTIVIISGGARGADQFGERYAWERGFNLIVVRPDWEAHGKGAGMIRNEQMAKMADALVAFWDGESKGTKHMIGLMSKEGKPTRVVPFDK